MSTVTNPIVSALARASASPGGGGAGLAYGLGELQSIAIPSEDPDFADLGQAFPPWNGRSKDSILQPPKPEIRPSAQVLERIMDRDWDVEAAH